MAAIGETRHIGGEGAGALEADAELRGDTHRDERHLCDLANRHRAVSAGDREGAVGKGDVGGVGLHEMGRETLAALDDLVRGGAQRAAADHHAARGVGAATDCDLVGVGLREMDLLFGHAEPVGDHLRIARLVPLAVRQRAGDDRQFTRRVEAQFHALVEDAGIVDIVGDAAAA